MLDITDLLDTGKGNAIPYEVLMRRLGIRTRRGLYRAIEQARKRGAVILPDGHGGYYLPDVQKEQAEIRTFNKRIRKLGVNTLATAKASRAIEKKSAEAGKDQRTTEQISFFDGK